MIAKLEKGRGFRGALNYALEKNGARLIGGNMASVKPRGMAREFRAFREMRPKLSKAVAHVALSVEQGANLTDEQWSEIGARYMQGMGYGDAAYTLVRHNDSEHDHVHIIASRIRPDGSVVSDSQDFRRQERIMRAIEQDFNLQAVPNSWESKGERALNKNEIEKADRAGEPPARVQLQALVGAAAKAADNYTDFALALDSCGVRHEVQLQKEGQKWNGVKFSLDGSVWFKGSDLGKQFTANGLQKNGVAYEQGRDFEAANERTINRAAFEQDAGSAGRSRGVGGSEPNQPEIGRPVGAGGPEIGQGHAEGTRTGRSSGQGTGHQQGRDQVANSHGDLYGWMDFRDDYVAGIAAAAVAASGDKIKSKALEVKEKAWQRQHEALQAPAYRLTLKARPKHLKTFVLGSKKDQEEVFYSYEEVQKKLSFLSKKNAEGYDIYLTPIDPSRRFLLVDDMTPEAEKALLNAGYSPALIQQSSDNNRQAVLICKRDADDDQHANKVVIGINEKYGDPALNSAVHAFRLAGFANKKEGKSSAFTRIVKAVNTLCSKAYSLIQQVRESAEREREQAKIDRANAIQVTDTQLSKIDFRVNTDDPTIAFLQAKQQILLLVQEKGWPYDESRADYMAAQTLFKQGYSFGQVVQGLYADPSIERKSDPGIYAERTAKAALDRLPNYKPKTAETPESAGFEQSEKQPNHVKKMGRSGPSM